MQPSDSTNLTTELLDALLKRGVSCRFKAGGNSMSPFIKNGDIVTLSPLSGLSPRLGDVIAFVHPLTGRLLVHRVIRKKGGRLSYERRQCREAGWGLSS